MTSGKKMLPMSNYIILGLLLTFPERHYLQVLTLNLQFQAKTSCVDGHQYNNKEILLTKEGMYVVEKYKAANLCSFYTESK